MRRLEPSSIFSREQAAGYDPVRLRAAKVMVVGVGAAGSNLIQDLALAGVGNISAVDPDHLEPSNLARSPLVVRQRVQGTRRRMKAREAGLALETMALPAPPAYRYTIGRIEELGLGALAWADVVSGCVDSNECRALLADWTRLIGKPFVELGFRGEWLNVSVFPNRQSDEPCWRCLHPEAAPGAVSCSLVAAQALSAGLVPAIQPTAAASAAIAAEAIIQAIHGNFPMGDARMHINIRTGVADRTELVRDPECPGCHEIWTEPTPLTVEPGNTVGALLAALAEHLADPRVELPLPFILELPCSTCGSAVKVRQPSWKTPALPICRSCRRGGGAAPSPSAPVVLTDIGRGDPGRDALCHQVGLGPAAIFRASDQTNASRVFRLAVAKHVGEQRTIATMRKLRAEGASFAAIAQQLNERDTKTKNGKKWHQ